MRNRHNLGPESAPWARDISNRLDALGKRSGSVRQLNINARYAGQVLPGETRTEIRREVINLDIESIDGTVTQDVSVPVWAGKVSCVATHFTAPSMAAFSAVGSVEAFFDDLRFQGYDPYDTYANVGRWFGGIGEDYRFSPVGWLNTEVQIRLVWTAMTPGETLSAAFILVWSA